MEHEDEFFVLIDANSKELHPDYPVIKCDESLAAILSMAILISSGGDEFSFLKVAELENFEIIEELKTKRVISCDEVKEEIQKLLFGYIQEEFDFGSDEPLE